MAVIAAQDRKSTETGKPPISAHPAFPAIVALWFAALFGFGSLILPTALLERVVSLTGLPAIIPAAAPPLGFTAQALLAGGAAIGGAIIGVLLARIVARAHRAGAPARLVDGATRKAIRAHDELGEDGLDGPSAAPSRRRKLALYRDYEAEEQVEDYPLEDAGEAASWAEEEEDLPILVEIDEEWDDAAPALAEPQAEDEYDRDEAPTAALPFAAPHPIADAEPADPFVAEEHPPREEPVPLADLGLPQLVQRLATSLEEYRSLLRQQAIRAPMAVSDPAPTGDLDVAEEAVLARAAYFQPAPAQPAADRESAEEDGEAPASFAPFASLATVEEDEEEEWTLDASLSLPLSAGSPDYDEDEDEAEDEEAAYGSLLRAHDDLDDEDAGVEFEDDPAPDHAAPLAAFPRAVNDSPPMDAPVDMRRPFDAPGHRGTGADATGPTRPAEADQALRAALSALQRMNGAA